MNIKRGKMFVFILLFIAIINISIPAQASIIDDIWNQGVAFIQSGEAEGSKFNGENMQEATDSLYDLFWWAGVVIATIVGAVLGIKFITESAEGKAKIKEALIPFCVGCAVIFGAFTIWRISMNIFNNLERQESNTVAAIVNDCGYGNHNFRSGGLATNSQSREITHCNNTGCQKNCDHSNMTDKHSNDGVSYTWTCNGCGTLFSGNLNECKHEETIIASYQGLPWIICKACGHEFGWKCGTPQASHSYCEFENGQCKHCHAPEN